MDISSISHLNKSTFEERKANLNYLRGLYFLFAAHLTFAWLWTLICLVSSGLGDFVLSNWPIALVLGIICVIAHLVCLLLQVSRNNPINWLLYCIFTVSFAYSVSWACLADGSFLVFFSLNLLTSIAIGFCLYSLFSQDYLQSLPAMLFILGSTVSVLVLFIIFSEVSFIGMLFCTILCIIFGFYLNYDIRKMVRGNVFSSWKEDPVSGAVRIWGEVGLVFCRLVELLGGVFHKDKH